MTLVERFIEFNDWPTSRKSALLYGISLPFHIFCAVTTQIVGTQLQWMNHGLVDAVMWGWSAELGICFLISLAAARSGVEGRWTLWLNVFPYSAFMVLTISLYGLSSTPFVLWFTSVNVLVTVWYSPRAGIYSFIYGLSLIVLYAVLLFLGKVPYAPALLDRSIDVQSSPIWTIHVFSLILIDFGFCFLMVVLLISAQQLQQVRLKEAQRKLDESSRLISRYVPSQLAERIISGAHHEESRPERLKLAVFFSDVEGFTDASDNLDPEEVATLLNEYLSEMMTIAERYSATVNQIVGDGIMIFFGAPQATSDRDHALRAVHMAMDMQRRMGELQSIWRQRGIDRPFCVRMGINVGYASVGDFGSPGRKLYSAIGIQTNLAARIQSHCKPGRVMISHSAWVLVRDEITCDELGELQFKGIRHAVNVYEVLDHPDVLRASHLRLAASRN